MTLLRRSTRRTIAIRFSATVLPSIALLCGSAAVRARGGQMVAPRPAVRAKLVIPKHGSLASGTTTRSAPSQFGEGLHLPTAPATTKTKSTTGDPLTALSHSLGADAPPKRSRRTAAPSTTPQQTSAVCQQRCTHARLIAERRCRGLGRSLANARCLQRAAQQLMRCMTRCGRQRRKDPPAALPNPLNATLSGVSKRL
ncbi:MAG: hypothetical protein H6707_02840 [Deltaproteobacteria bacterium]|nr:hypothetical protein [Deltaproteobacteria bacterium]